MAFIKSIWQSIVNAVTSFDLIKFLEGMDKFQILYKYRNALYYSEVIYGAVIAALVIIAVLTFATCLVFRKADMPWWKALIPIGGTYNTYGLGDCEVIFCFNLIISLIFLPLMNADMPVAILSIYVLLMIVLEFTFCCFLARSFGKKLPFAVGLFLLRPVFMLILAFDKSKYSFDRITALTSSKKAASA